LSPQAIEAALARAGGRLGSFGCQVQWHAELPSTNDRAAAAAENGAPEGSLVLADTQTAGRGRRGRSWCSPPGAGLYASVVLRPEPRVISLVTIAAGVALADGIRAATGLETMLKWPNDVQAASPGAGRAGRKLAGILAESGAAPGGAPHVVLGFGINVVPAAYPPDVAARATSLEAELGRPVDRDALLVECLAALASRYDEVHRTGAGGVLAAWRGYARPLLGRAVEWDDRGRVRRGTADDIDASGALIVRTGEGIARVISGEVRWM
jgi:BirA family transcriptional regulator, biotin operon repressor / biotin---[acetyl-CoA-carboxylase] ligase